MEILYENLPEIERFDRDENNKRIRIKISFLSSEEKEILEKYKINYRYTIDDKIEIVSESFVYFLVELNNENKGIFLEKTENYYNYFKNPYTYELKEKNINLVISKEDCKVELIFVDGVGGFKNEF